MQSLRPCAKPPGWFMCTSNREKLPQEPTPPAHMGLPPPRSSASVTPPPQDLGGERPRGQSSSTRLSKHRRHENNPLAWSPLRPKWGSDGEISSLEQAFP